MSCNFSQKFSTFLFSLPIPDSHDMLWTLVNTNNLWKIAREGIINVCYENDPFNDFRDVFIASRTAIINVVIIANVTVVVINCSGILPQL